MCHGWAKKGGGGWGLCMNDMHACQLPPLRARSGRSREGGRPPLSSPPLASPPDTCVSSSTGVCAMCGQSRGVGGDGSGMNDMHACQLPPLRARSGRPREGGRPPRSPPPLASPPDTCVSSSTGVCVMCRQIWEGGGLEVGGGGGGALPARHSRHLPPLPDRRSPSAHWPDQARHLHLSALSQALT